MLSSLSRSIGSVLVRRGLGEKLRDRCEVVECCGIVGYAGPQDASTILTTGVELLQNRGYDSCGIATCFKKKLITTKFASKGTTSDCVDSLKHASAARHGGHNIGIAHTRWATHGGKTDQNAHPHSDFKNRIALVHNGTIDNFLELKQELKAHGIQFKSETDTEVIANLIGYYLDKNYTLENAVRKAVSRLTGTWGIAVIHKDDANGIVCARNGSPLIIGSAPGQIFVASEPLAMAEHTNEFVALNDGDVVYVNSSTGITDIVDGRDKRTIEIEDVKHNPSPHAHWTEREIYEQPEALSRALNYGARLGKGGSRIKLGGLEQNEAQLKKLKRMVITGCGTSLNAGLYGELLMRSLGCFDSVYTVDSSEVDSRTFGKSGDDTALLALTQSGETRDVVTALQEATKMNMRLVSVVNQVGSLVARMSGCGVYLNAGREVAVASTKAFTSQVAVLALIACWFAQLKETGNTTVDHLVLACESVYPCMSGHAYRCDSVCMHTRVNLFMHPYRCPLYWQCTNSQWWHPNFLLLTNNARCVTVSIHTCGSVCTHV